MSRSSRCGLQEEGQLHTLELFSARQGVCDGWQHQGGRLDRLELFTAKHGVRDVNLKEVGEIIWNFLLQGKGFAM